MRAAGAVGAVDLAALVVLQLAPAAGLPLGGMAWGGAHRGLPARLRVGRAVLLARAGQVAPGAEHAGVRVGTWPFAAWFVLDTVTNLASRSAAERRVMTPAAVLLAACFAYVSTT